MLIIYCLADSTRELEEHVVTKRDSTIWVAKNHQRA